MGAIAVHHVAHKPRHGSVRGCQVGSDSDKVEIRSCIEQGAAHGDADGASEIPHHVEQPTLSGGRLPRPRLTAGATAKTCGRPRNICGMSSWSAPQSWVMKL